MTANEIFEFLEYEVNDKLNNLRLLYPDQDAFLSKVNAMSVLFTQRNIMSITDERSIRTLIDTLTVDEHRDVRIEFLLQLTAKMKFMLGSEDWREVNDRVLGSLRIVTPDTPDAIVSKYAMLGEINSSLLKINMDVVDSNHWIIPLILFGLHNRIPVQINEYLNTLIQMNSSTPTKKRRYGPVSVPMNE